MPRQTPFEAVRAGLGPRLGARSHDLPRQWERLGDVLVLRGLTRRFGEQAHEVARVYAETLGARLVLEDTGGIAGRMREPTMKRLWGSGPGETTLTQDRIRYTLDAERLMFSSGNLGERERMGRLAARDQLVVDLFAGIGYFTLPLLVHAGARRVVACEINPRAAGYLRTNARDNRVDDRLEVRVGDCRNTAPEGVADRVVSGWFPRGHTYLDTAMRTLRADGGVLHYHDTAHASRPREELTAHLHAAARRSGKAIRDVNVRVVKSYAPGVVHAVADARVAPIDEAGPVRIGTDNAKVPGPEDSNTTDFKTAGTPRIPCVPAGEQARRGHPNRPLERVEKPHP